MSSINFVPDDYVQNNESRRMNCLCVVLLILVMAGLIGAFVTIKMRQKAFLQKEALVNAKMVKMKQAICTFEELQAKRKEMMRTALTTAELLEPVPRSILLATLTNHLPPGTSLSKLNLLQKSMGKAASSAPVSNYQAAKGAPDAPKTLPVSPEKQLETFIDIQGMAPTDLQVASYIERLGNCSLLDHVALIESKESKGKEGEVYRQYKLTAKLCKNVHLTNSDIEEIRAQANTTIFNF